MPTTDTLELFIACVEANAHAEAIESFYTESASMQENNAPPRDGRDLLVANERKVQARIAHVTSKCIRPALVNGDHVVIRWVFEIIWLDGRRNRIDELAWQRWEGDLIAEEQFFYDPAQLKS